MARTGLSVAAAILTALIFAVLPRAARRDAAPPIPDANVEAAQPASPTAACSRTFQSVRREAVALAEDGRLADAVAVGTEALRIGEKSLGQDGRVSREALDRLANSIERWYVQVDGPLGL